MQTTWQGETLRVLAENGFNLNKNLKLVDRYSDGNPDRLPRLASEITAAGVDVIVAVSDPSVRAAMAASAGTPIVMVVGEDPIAAGFVRSHARPGGRVTGVFFQTTEGDAKRLELLSQALPRARRFGLLVPRGKGPRSAERITQAAKALQVDLISHIVADPSEYPTAFAAMKKAGAAGVLVAASQAWGDNIVQVVAAAKQYGLPTTCEWTFQAQAGCVFGYGHDLPYAQRRVGEYAVRILRGASPAELPVEESDRWKLVVNLKAAKALAIALPSGILARADEVIE